MTTEMELNFFEENNAYAAENRHIFRQAGVFVLNVTGSSGSGKTTLLGRLLRLMQQHIHVAVIGADLATAKDARRISESGISVIQINTGDDGQLDALMVSRVLPGFYLDDIDMLLIEKEGQLGQAPTFDLGEDLHMVVMSIAEGGDKPDKYPAAFQSADIAVLNKIDMLSQLDLDLAETGREISAINPQIKIFQTCCRKGEVTGVDELAAYLISLTRAKRSMVDD